MISSIIGILGMLISTGVIVIFLNVISNIKYQLKNPEIMKKFGGLYEDTNYSKKSQRIRLAQFYIIIFLLRRLCYALIVIFLAEHQLLQQIMNISIHTMAFLYDIIMKPYSMKTVLGLLIYTFDFIAMIIFASLPMYMNITTYSEQAGRIHIYIIIATCGISWIIIVVIMVLRLCLLYKNYKIAQNTPEVIYTYIYYIYIYVYIYIYIISAYRKNLKGNLRLFKRMPKLQ